MIAIHTNYARDRVFIMASVAEINTLKHIVRDNNIEHELEINKLPHEGMSECLILIRPHNLPILNICLLAYQDTVARFRKALDMKPVRSPYSSANESEGDKVCEEGANHAD